MPCSPALAHTEHRRWVSNFSLREISFQYNTGQFISPVLNLDTNFNGGYKWTAGEARDCILQRTQQCDSILAPYLKLSSSHLVIYSGIFVHFQTHFCTNLFSKHCRQKEKKADLLVTHSQGSFSFFWWTFYSCDLLGSLWRGSMEMASSVFSSADSTSVSLYHSTVHCFCKSRNT